MMAPVGVLVAGSADDSVTGSIAGSDPATTPSITGSVAGFFAAASRASSRATKVSRSFLGSSSSGAITLWEPMPVLSSETGVTGSVSVLSSVVLMLIAGGGLITLAAGAV